MALINCPECGKEISDKAKNCIHCGYPLDFSDSESIPNVIENADEKSDSTVHIDTTTENISQTTKNENEVSFFNRYKKTIVACLFGVVAIVLLIVFLNRPQPTFEEKLVGMWTSSKDASAGEASISFEYEEEKLSGEMSFYDYDKSEWGKLSFVVKNRTDYTMTLLYESGKIDIVSYSAKGDTLIFDGIVYTNADKDIENSRIENPIHLINGVEYPVWNEMYFGMSQEEVKAILEEDIQEQKDDIIEADIPTYFTDYFSYIEDYSNVEYKFKDNKLNRINITFFFNYKCTDSQIQGFIDDLVKIFNSEYGYYDYKGQPYSGDISDITVYAWEYGNNEITIDYDGGYIYVNVEFTTGQTIMNLYANK